MGLFSVPCVLCSISGVAVTEFRPLMTVRPESPAITGCMFNTFLRRLDISTVHLFSNTDVTVL